MPDCQHLKLSFEYFQASTNPRTPKDFCIVRCLEPNCKQILHISREENIIGQLQGLHKSLEYILMALNKIADKK
jgi:hypothetical protein